MNRFLSIFVSAVTLAVLISQFDMATAQTRQPATVRALKTTNVDISGDHTIKEFLDLLSKRSHLMIEAPSYLQARHVYLDLNGTSAEAALDSVCILNDWICTETSPSKLLITRRVVKAHSRLDDRLLAVMPLDIREYIASSGTTTGEKPATQANPVEVHAASALREQKERANSEIQKRSLAQRAATTLRNSFVDNEKGWLRSYSSFTSQQRRLLLDTLCLVCLRDISSPNQGLRNLPNYVKDPSRLVLEITNGNALTFLETTIDGDAITQSGFGGVIPGLAEIPDPALQKMQDAIRKARGN